MSATQTATTNPTQGFAERAINLTFQLGSGTFTNTQSNILSVSGLRVQASIAIPGTVPLQGGAQVAVYGLPLQVMNDLSSLGNALYFTKNNSIVIEAGDVGRQMSAVFTGTIAQAYADFDGGPDAAFQVIAIPGYFAKVVGTQPNSYPGSVSVTTILSALCQKAGLQFQGNGVSVTLSNPYFPGTIIDQIDACIEAANLRGCIQNGTLSVWNDAASTPSTGLSLKALFNPALQNGQTFQVQSILTPACGTWQSQVITHDLESQAPGGQWFTTIQATQPGIVLPPGG
jgi:hypothetical protein